MKYLEQALWDFVAIFDELKGTGEAPDLTSKLVSCHHFDAALS